MKLRAVACVIASSILLAAAVPASAKSTKYTADMIGAKNTCRNDDVSMPVKECIKKFAEKFCKDKGHKTYVMANWGSSGAGFSAPNLIYCK